MSRRIHIPRIKVPFIAKAAISLLLLTVVLVKVDLSSVFQVLGRADFLLCLLSISIAVGAWLVNTYKWQVLLTGPGIRPKYSELLRLNLIGMFYNLVLPGQVGGEVVKGFKLTQLGTDGKRAAISVIADRVTGLLALLGLGILGIFLSPSVGGRADLLPWLVALAVLLGLVTVMLITGAGLNTIRDRLPAGRLMAKLKLETWHLEIGDESWPTLLTSMVLAVIFQLGIVLANYLFCLALNIPINYLQLLWVVAGVSILQSLPISIAGVGVREGAFVYLLGLLGVAEPAALALSLLVFATQILFALVGGLLQVQEVWESRHKSILPSK